MNLLKRYVVPAVCAMTVLAMAACSSSKDERRVPVPLTQFKPVLNVQQVWKASVGKADRYLFSPVAVGDAVFAAGANGSVVKIDAQTGKEVWSTQLPAGGQANPMTYSIDGKQVVAIFAGGHHFMKTPVGDYLEVFGLPDDQKSTGEDATADGRTTSQAAQQPG